MSPFTWFGGRLRCVVGSHHRSATKARRTSGEEQYESVCTYCGVPMVRLAKRNWVVKPKR